MNQSVLLFKRVAPLEMRILLRRFRWKLTYYLQTLLSTKGTKDFYCPVNDKEYRSFVKNGPLLISPDLGARERHRFIWHYLKHQSDVLDNDKTLLHISPEYCFYQKFVNNQRRNYFPVDKFEPGYDYLNLTQNFDLLKIDESEKGKYAYIICNHVLEHIEEDSVAIANLYNLLDPDGVAFVSVPIHPENFDTLENPEIKTAEERKKHYGQWDHVRYYGLDIVKRFENAGFKVKTINSSEYFTPEEQDKFGVKKPNYLFVLTK